MVEQPEQQEPQDPYQEASTSVADYVRTATPVAREKRKRRVRLIIILIALLLLAGGGAAYYFLFRSPNKPAETAQPATTPVTEEPEPEVPTETENFVSQSLKLTLDYPSNWALDDDTTGQIKISSPKVKIKNADGESVSGTVVVLIRAKNLPLPEFDSGDAAAAIASEKFSYTQPTSNQRQETFLSFLSFSGDTNSIDNAFITGDSGYQAGAAIPKADLGPVEPIVSVAFYTCEDDCKTPEPVAVEEWGTHNFFQAAKEVLRSLSIN